MAEWLICMKTIKFDFKTFLRKYGTISILIIMCAALTIITPNFLKVRNLLNIVKQISIYAIMGCGLTMVIITGGIDLSAGAVVAVAGMVFGTLNMTMGIPMIAAIILTLLVGALIGMFNGSMVAFFNIPAFVATLGSKLALFGIALIINDKPISGFDQSFLFLGQGSFCGIPVLIFFLLVVGMISHYLLKHTKFGRYVYAIGGNSEAARVSGINIRKTLVSVYVYNGILQALAGILLASRIMTSSPNSGDGFEMEGITGAVIGGASLAGGSGTIMGTIIGTLIVGVLNNGLDLMLVDAYTQQVLKGMIIIAAVIFDQIKNKR